MAYRPSKFILNYIKEHGGFNLTEEELNKCIEILNFSTRFSKENSNLSQYLTVSEELKNTRKSICLKCEHYNFNENNPDNSSCNLCGCNVNHKVSQPLDECPGNKWDISRHSLKNIFLESIRLINEMKDTSWIDLMTHEDFEQLLIDNYQKQQQEKKDE